MSNNDAVIEFLFNQLQQQLTNNPYKQQCEDMAHEVQSLKNQLRDASALVVELQEDNIKKSEHISHLSELVDELMGTITLMNGDVEAYKVLRKGGYIRGGQNYVVGEHGPEQSGCRKEDAQGCDHVWYRYNLGDYTKMCVKCGLKK